ncbi:MAG: four helix bundle protein [Candidatus Cloacimonetes bacterium]|nr:four helix bundle protein [Candidatus Cloacimonadota bacterium]MBS3768456.1 four helix bundle protein [Candidatus Cloacimonadota bacterium]
MYVKSAKELDVYKLAYKQAIEIFDISKNFPEEEKYSLTNQIRRSSRSVCANLREAWSKRRYIAHFISKITDCDGENSETETWIDFAKDCKYISTTDYKKLSKNNKLIGQKLGTMIKKADKFCGIIDD